MKGLNELKRLQLNPPVYGTNFLGFVKSRTRFDDLPPELLSNVASYLCFRDLLACRQASRKLRNATEARTVWLALATEYRARHLGYPSPAAGPLETLETEQIRQWITERSIIDEIWKSPAARPRSSNLEWKGDPLSVAIVPGGRWALVGDGNGCIRCYDLSSKDPQPFPLIKPSRDAPGTRQPVQRIVISVDSQSPTLQFNIALTGECFQPVSWLHVWHVKLEPDDTLSAQKLVSIPCTRFTAGFSLSNDLVARTVIKTEGGGAWTEVFPWKECSPTRLVKSTIRMKRQQPEFIQIIGNDRLFSADPQMGLYIYEIPSPDVMEYKQAPEPLYLEDALACEPLWSHSLQGGDQWGYSRLYFDGENYRQVISTDNGIFGVVIPALRDELPRVLKLAHITLNSFPLYGLGLYKGYAALEGDGARFGYSWDNCSDSPTYRNISGGKLTPIDYWYYLAFDEETGRFIGITENHTLFIDFLP